MPAHAAVSWRGSSGAPQNVTWLCEQIRRLGDFGDGHNDAVVPTRPYRRIENDRGVEHFKAKARRFTGIRSQVEQGEWEP